jgi:catechol 2,3-dioxygenase-like lactoylglutathione lyase family enzyme
MPHRRGSDDPGSFAQLIGEKPELYPPRSQRRVRIVSGVKRFWGITMSGGNLGFTKLVVGDLEKSAAFYKSVCGLTEQARVTDVLAGRAISEILFEPAALGGHTFVLLNFHDTAKPAVGEAILGFTVTDIVGFVARVRVAGGTVLDDVKAMPTHGVKVAIVKDIEGHLIEVVELL